MLSGRHLLGTRNGGIGHHGTVSRLPFHLASSVPFFFLFAELRVEQEGGQGGEGKREMSKMGREYPTRLHRLTKYLRGEKAVHQTGFLVGARDVVGQSAEI